MGLSIHYSGRIKNTNLISFLAEEVSEICVELDWKSQLIKSDEITGVSFGPKESEALYLTFNPEGRLLSPINIMVKEIYEDDENDDLFFTASTKTQYAGPEAHIALIKLLKYLSKKYFEEFNVSDESYYWEPAMNSCFISNLKDMMIH